MNIIILTMNYENYVSGSYHYDIVKAIQKKGNCYLYGENYPDYSKSDTIEEVISKSPFNKNDIDMIIVGTTWEVQDENIGTNDPHPRINLRNIDIPRVFFLNKEYKKLDLKLEYAKKNEFDLVCTVHQNYDNWAKQTGLNFIQVPFAADPMIFKDYGLPKKYDFGFSGNLHRKHTDIRYRIKCKLFKNPEAKSLAMNVFFNYNPIKIGFSKGKLNDEYKKFKIYWAEWGTYNLLGRSLLPSGKNYARFLNEFKVFLSTPSALDIINTRFFECLASKTLLFCPQSKSYGGLLSDGFNCIMFKEDLTNFSDKLHEIIIDNEKRKMIIENAYNDFIRNHTYEKRIDKIISFFK